MCESNPSDEMTSFEVMHQNDMEESLESDGFSIIPNPPAEVEILGSGNFDNMQSTFMCASHDLSVQEIQARLVDLAKDNSSMKEALEWNNVMMKEQLSTISAWHSQMTTSMSKTQLSLKEATEKVEAFEAENAELRGKLKQQESNLKCEEETCKHDCQSSQAIAVRLKEADQLIAELNLKLEERNIELAALKKAASRLEEADQTIAELNLKLEDKNVKVAALKKSASKLKDADQTIEEMTQKLVDKHVELEALKNTASRLEGADQTIAKLNLNLEKQTLELASLKKIASRLEEGDQSISELNSKLEKSNLELAAVKKIAQEKEALIVSYEEKQNENEALKSQCNNLCEELKTMNLTQQFLKENLSDLDSKLILEHQVAEAESIKYMETKKLLNALQSKYDRLLLLHQTHSEDQDGENQLEFFEKKFFEQIDNLTAQLLEMEDRLAERAEKVDQLTLQLQNVEEDSESVPVLKSQLEVYKLDLSNVKQAKEEADLEIQRLTQLLEALQAYTTGGPSLARDEYTRVNTRFNGRTHSSGARQDSKLYVCPLCNFGFKDAQAAQNHANKCLDDAQVN